MHVKKRAPKLVFKLAQIVAGILLFKNASFQINGIFFKASEVLSWVPDSL